jgi:opacity protein-like surface antigen
MRKNVFIIIICGLLMSIPEISPGGEARGVYISASAGMAYLGNSDITFDDIPQLSGEVKSDMGFACGGALGYDFGNIRLEGEVAYQQNDFDEGKTNLTSGLEFPLTGDSSSLAFLCNGYYDFTNESPFSFFITGGIGAAKVEINDINIPGSGVPGYSDDDTVFAYQGGAGVGYDINRNINFFIKYRYLGTSDLDLQFDGVKVETDYSSHNIYAGIRITFLGQN